MADAVRNLIGLHVWLQADRILAEPSRERRRAMLDQQPAHLREQVKRTVVDRFHKKN